MFSFFISWISVCKIPKFIPNFNHSKLNMRNKPERFATANFFKRLYSFWGFIRVRYSSPNSVKTVHIMQIKWGNANFKFKMELLKFLRGNRGLYEFLFKLILLRDLLNSAWNWAVASAHKHYWNPIGAQIIWREICGAKRKAEWRKTIEYWDANWQRF